MTHVEERCVCTSGLSSGYPPDMIFEQQPGPGLRPPCRSRFCRASATRRFARSPTRSSTVGLRPPEPAGSPPRQRGRPSSLFASVWLPRSPTIVCSSIPRLRCRFRRSARSHRAIYRRARLSDWSTRCRVSIARSCWSARTPAFGGEKLQGYADATSTRCAPASA